MAKATQLRRGTTAQNATFTGAPGEITVDTTLNSIRLHDGSTEGGNALAGVAPLSIARYVQSTSQDADSITPAKVTYATAVIEDAIYSISAGVVTVTAAGNYLVKGKIGVEGTTTDYRWSGTLMVQKNGVDYSSTTGGYIRATNGANATYLQSDALVTLAVGDTIELTIKRHSSRVGNATSVAAETTLDIIFLG